MRGQREDKGRGSRWGGRGGGGDVCQEGWLGSTSEGTEGRKKVSQAFLISLHQFISLCLFLFPVFTPHLDSLSFFSFSTPLLDSSHCLSFSFLSRLYMSSSLSSFSFIPPFHGSVSLLGTFFPLLPLCVCFNHLLVRSIFSQGKSLA